MAEATPDAEQLMQDYAEMWNNQDTSKIPDLVTESFEVQNPNLPEGKTRGREGLKAWMNEVTSAFPDFHVEILDIVGSGETVMTEVQYTMTHKGEFAGVPPTGRKVEQKAAAKFRIEDGKVAEHRDYVNQQAVFEQLGVTED